MSRERWAVAAALAVGVLGIVFVAVGCSTAGAAGVSAVAAILSVVATAAYAVISYGQWKAIERQAELTQRLAESAERPAMLIADTMFAHSGDGTIDRLGFTLANTGKGIALKVRAHLEGEVLGRRIAGNTGRSRVFGVGQFTPVMISFDAGPAAWGPIHAGTAKLSATLRVTYTDQVGAPYEATYELGFDTEVGSTIVVAGDIRPLKGGSGTD